MFTLTDADYNSKYFWGKLNIKNDAIRGNWGIEHLEADGPFVLNLLKA